MRRQWRQLLIALMAILIVVSTIDSSEQSPDKASNEDSYKKVSVQDLAEALEKLRHLKSDSCHVLIREASLLFPRRFRGVEWQAIQKLMQKESITIINESNSNGIIDREYALKSSVFALPNDRALDLHLLLRSYPNNKGLEAKQGEISYVATVELIANLNAPYDTLIKQTPFPPGTVLDLVVRANEVAKVGVEWPLMKRVSVCYGYLNNRWLDYCPSGFAVTVEFCASTNKNIGGKDLRFRIPSGMDPVKSRDGNQESQDFKPKDVLLDLEEAGGSEWWHGDHDTVERNKRLYLKAKK